MMILRFSLPVLVCALSLAACEPAKTPQASSTTLPPAVAAPVAAEPARVGKIVPLTAEGFGALRIGMAEAEAEAASGGFAPGLASKDCHYRSPTDASLGYLVMFEEGRASSLRTSKTSTLQTDHTLGLGATEAAVRSAYPQGLIEEQHKYRAAPAKRLLHWDKADVSGVIYEIDESGKVISINAGGPSIRYVEGCS